MDSFTYHNPTKLIFGKGQLDALPDEVNQYGRKVLLVYGTGSIKRNGIYHNVIGKLKAIDAEVFELAGVEPNPRISTVRKGVAMCKQEGIEFILAVGGGSTIDCAKAIAVGAKTEIDMWDIVTKKEQARDALPFGTVLTHAATGSEMNRSSVITNWETKEKHGWGSPYTYPKFSILDPTHTFTVPKDHTVHGIVDIMSHVLEHYFHPAKNTPVQDRFSESILQTVIETAPKLLHDLESYEHRETIMFCGTMALNDMLSMGARGDWGAHHLEHAVSAVHDIPHGAGLAIIFPNWMKHVIDESNVARFKQLAMHVFHVQPEGKTDEEVAVEGMDRLRKFWSSLGAPSRLSEYGIDETSIEEMANKTVIARASYGNYVQLEKQDSVAILKASL